MTEQKTRETAQKFDIAEWYYSAIQNRITWEEGTFASSNSELYAILADCLDLFQKAANSAELVDGIDTLMKKLNLKCTNRTSLAVKIVRLIFATEQTQDKIKYRLYGYANALECAHAANVTKYDFADFVIRNGGIDELRRAKSSNSSSDRERSIELAKKHLRLNSTGLIASLPKFPDALKPKAGKFFSVALITAGPDGTANIVHASHSESLIASALAEAGELLVNNIAQNAVAQLESRAAAQSDENAQTVAQSWIARQRDNQSEEMMA